MHGRGVWGEGQLLVVAAFYALVALLVLYMPIFHLGTHLPGSGVTDYYHAHWNYWWIRHALTTGHTIYETNYVMAPFTTNLAFHTLAPFWYPIWAAVEPTFGTVTAMTAIFIAAFTLTGLLFYLLLRREGVSNGLALVGGAMLEITPLMIVVMVWANVNLMGWFWLPALILLWGKIAGSPPRRAPLWTGVLALALWSMILTDLQYPLFAGPLLVPYVALTLWRAESWSTRLRLVALGAVACAAALILLWYLGPLPYILKFDRSELAMTPAERAAAVPFPWGYIWHVEKGVPVGAVLLPLVVGAVIINVRALIPRPFFPQGEGLGVRGSRWFWLALMIAPLLCSVGAYIAIGETRIPMPYVLVHQVFGGMFRYPERFVPVFLIPGVLFAFLTLTPVLERHPRWRIWLPALLMLLVIADSRILRSVPIQPMPTPYSFYAAMGREPYDYVILDVPTGGASGEGIVGEPEFMTTQFYGIAHGKRMVNGHFSRVDIAHYWYMRTDDPMMAWLGQRRFIEPETVGRQLRERIYDWPIGYIVIHKQWIERSGPTLQEIVGYFNALGDLLCPYTSEGDALVYRTAWHPDGCPPRTPPEVEPGVYRVDIGSPDDERYIGWGWHRPERVFDITLRWMGQYPQTRLYVDLPPGAYTLTLTAQAFWENRQLRLLVNDVLLGDLTTVSVDALREYTFTVPVRAVGDGRHVTVTFDYDTTIVPVAVGQSADERPLALAVDWVEFRRID